RDNRQRQPRRGQEGPQGPGRLPRRGNPRNKGRGALVKTAHPHRPAPRAEPGSPLLTVENLAVSYGGIKALKGVSLEVNRGEIVAMIGANGAGKTTTLKTVVRLLPIA